MQFNIAKYIKILSFLHIKTDLGGIILFHGGHIGYNPVFKRFLLLNQRLFDEYGLSLSIYVLYKQEVWMNCFG